ncbi:MAG: PilN domain-containing protein [Massilia sp.]
MIKINLLPHREAKRKLKKAAFLALLAVSAVAGVLIVIAVGGVNASRISTQNDRNNVLKKANAELDTKIAEIATLKQEIEALKARQQAVEDLQGDRNQPVYLLEELVRQTPQGIYLKSFKQEGQRVTLVGSAQSQERVAEMLRNVSNGSPWLDHPSLVEVRSELLVGSKTGKKIGAFTMAVDIKRQRDKDAAEASATAAPGAAGKPGVKPGAPAPAVVLPGAAPTAVLAPLAKPPVAAPPAKAAPAAAAPIAPPVAASAPKAK